MTAKKYEISVENMMKELEIAKAILFEARLKRPRPHLDNKIITAWNGKIYFKIYFNLNSLEQLISSKLESFVK